VIRQAYPHKPQVRNLRAWPEPGGSAETTKKKACDLSNFHWQAKLGGLGTTVYEIFPAITFSCYYLVFSDGAHANVCPLIGKLVNLW
jgi:hypothetical protein